MKRSWARTIGLAVLSACRGPTPTQPTNGGADVPVENGHSYRLGFDDAPVGALPADMINVLGQWSVSADASAGAAAKVLRQTGSFRNPDFPRVVVKGLCFADLSLRVHCRPEKGDLDQACGLLFRLQDSDNYYVTRANALEHNVRLYRVIAGDRQQLASADLHVAAGQWHTLEASARGANLQVHWDGKLLLSTTDGTFAKGKVGLWTKADSVTAFKQFEATAQ
jgi:hypothetical protein